MYAKIRRSVFTGLALVGGSMPSLASADWHSFWRAVDVDYARVQAWPQPFTDVDARQTVMPFEVMKQNGWRLHNTIGHDLFRDVDGALMAAGHRRVQWIATQAPSDRRVIYVLKGRTPSETDGRLAAVRATLAQVETNGPPPQLMITEIEPTTSSGDWATQVNREWLNSLPAPKLPTISASGNSGVNGG